MGKLVNCPDQQGRRSDVDIIIHHQDRHAVDAAKVAFAVRTLEAHCTFGGPRYALQDVAELVAVIEFNCAPGADQDLERVLRVAVPLHLFQRCFGVGAMVRR
ncbi:hypothetical protein D3C86_1390080 [compost metagenome]